MTPKGTPEGTRTGTVGPESNLGDPFSSLRLFEASQRRKSNIPIQTTPLVDREKEFATLRNLIHQENVRLITLTGPGGTGKTRLAIEVTSNLRDEFSDGVVFVSLASVTDAKLVPSKIVSTLDIMEKAGEPIEDTLKQFLKGKRTLLLLDNFEQVIGAALFAAQLLHECQDLKIIVTSRAPLRVQGEYEFPVLPLAVPDLARIPAAQELVLYAAVALFVQRAQAIRADFTVTSKNSKVLAEICTRLDGLPLALELAAARTRVLSLEDLLVRLQERLQLLTGGRRDLPERQQTLRNTIAWSYDLLDQSDKTLFRRLSVFGGSFSLEAAEEICVKQDNYSHDTIDQLSRLVEKSLLLSEQAENEMRFRMLETIRAFGHELLVSSGESVRTEKRFVDYFLTLAEEAAANLRGANQTGILIRLDNEQDNIRTALHLAVQDTKSEQGLRLGSALWNFWNIRGYHTEGRAWLTRALENAGPVHSIARARALTAAGALAKWQNDFPAASSLLNASLTLSKELGDKEVAGYALNYLANVDDDLGNFAAAHRLYEQSLTLFREIDDKWGVALVLNNLGVWARYQGDYEQATTFHEQSLKLFTELGDKRRVAHSLINLGSVLERKAEFEAAREMFERSLSLFRGFSGKVGIAESCFLLGTVSRKQGDYERGRKQLTESLIVSNDVGYREIIVNCLEEFATFDCVSGQTNRAARLLGAASTMREAMQFPIPPAYLAEKNHNLALVRSSLGEKQFLTEWSQGRIMTVEEAIAYTLTSEQANS